MKLHELKTDPDPFQWIWSTRKTFDVRKEDRGFMQGDVLRLREHDRSTNIYTGREVLVRVLYVLCGPAYGIEAGYVCMSFKMLTRLGQSDDANEKVG